MRKEFYEDYFKNKKVTVMGLGLLGRGIGDTAFLVSCGANIVVTDLKNKEQLQDSLEILKDYKNIEYHLGGHMMTDFEEKDFILKSAGVPLDSEYIQHAKNNKIPVAMSASLVCDIVMKTFPTVTIIGVTGTRGKTTATELIAHVLRENNSRVHVGGNIRGVANLPLLEAVEEDDYLVMELDSWQLQGFGEMKISPHIAVFTSFMDDHMNYYKNNKGVYFNDKANIYRFQKKEDVLIATNQVIHEIQKYDSVRSPVIPKDAYFDMKLIGKHNQEIAGLAYEVCVRCGLDDESIRNAIKTFSPTEGRLEDVGVFHGVRVFNDNNATTGDATVVAIKSINEKYNTKPIIILGGTDKGLELINLEKEIKENTKAHILLAGTGTDRLTLSKEHMYETLEECLNKAFSLAKEGDIILFSPAFASFSKYFNNEYERNDAFVTLVQSYATV